MDQINITIDKTFNKNNIKKDDTDENDINKPLDGNWSRKKQLAVENWIGYLEYIQLIVYFHMFQLKKIENFWSWLIIVLSAITSTISVVQFDKENTDLVLAINVMVSVFTVFTTLIASWIKKQNYVQRIGDLEKYLQSLNILISELKGQIKIGPEDRVPWAEFLERYRDKINEFESSAPLISPENWKETNYTLTKYYPELVKNAYPWCEDKTWGDNILKTYSKVKYRKWYDKVWKCYCCRNKDEFDKIEEKKEPVNQMDKNMKRNSKKFTEI